MLQAADHARARSPAPCPAPLPPCLQDTRRSYRELFFTAPIGAAGIAGAICFKETLAQSAADGTPFTHCLLRQGVLPGIKARRCTGGAQQGPRALPAARRRRQEQVALPSATASLC